jgi:hypothetical protein
MRDPGSGFRGRGLGELMMGIRLRFMVLAAALVLLGTTFSIRAEVGSPSGPESPLCRDGRCRCGSCGAEHCRVVPDIKTTKKWIYCTKLVPYCRKKCPNPLHCKSDCCDTCPQCESCVRYKRVLMKREVVMTKRGYKCVPSCGACRTRTEGPAAKPAPAATKEASAPTAPPGEYIAIPGPPAPSPADSEE